MPSGACTAACTSEAENANADTLDPALQELIRAWRTLPQATRAAVLGLVRQAGGSR